jgi:hypothetical protein
MHSQLQNHMMHQRMSYTRWEVTLGITSFSMSRLRRFHKGIHTDSSNPVRSIQQAAGGVSGMDADMQAWLAKYATRPSHDNAYSVPGAQTADQISAILRDQFGI